MDAEKLGWLKASEYRQNILLSISDKPKTPKEISEDTDLYLSHVSKTLSDLVDKNLAKSLTPDRKKGGLYQASEEGKELAELI